MGQQREAEAMGWMARNTGPNAPPQRPGKGAAGACVSPCARRGGWGRAGVVLAPALAPPRSADSRLRGGDVLCVPAPLSARCDLHLVLGPAAAQSRSCRLTSARYRSIRRGRLAVSISRFCRRSRLHRSRWARAAAVMRGSATRSPRLSARAARSSLSSRPMLAAITAVLSRRSGLVGSMGAFCKTASGRSIPEIIQALISCSFSVYPAETVFGRAIS